MTTDAALRYRPEIDGLRSVAVVPVVLFHAGFQVFSGGYVGVDVFFVISGYLITGILLSDIERQRYSIARFYERRARRILPALLAVMLCCLPLARAVMLPGEIAGFGNSILAVLCLVSNIEFWREEGYFSIASELKRFFPAGVSRSRSSARGVDLERRHGQLERRKIPQRTCLNFSRTRPTGRRRCTSTSATCLPTRLR